MRLKRSVCSLSPVTLATPWGVRNKVAQSVPRSDFFCKNRHVLAMEVMQRLVLGWVISTMLGMGVSEKTNDARPGFIKKRVT